MELITKLYPQFGDIAASHAAFLVTLEIQGLNELYAAASGTELDEGESLK